VARGAAWRRPLLTAIGGRSADHRARRNARRVLRARRDRLRAELASYTTPSERAELEAMLERHTDEEVAQLAAMLR
jgi:hypothetical protein